MLKFEGFNDAGEPGISAKIYKNRVGTYTVLFHYPDGFYGAGCRPTEDDAVAYAKEAFKYLGCTFEQTN